MEFIVNDIRDDIQSKADSMSIKGNFEIILFSPSITLNEIPPPGILLKFMSSLIADMAETHGFIGSLTMYDDGDGDSSIYNR